MRQKYRMRTPSTGREVVIDASPEGLDTVMLANTPIEELSRLVALAHGAQLRACVVATRLEEALAAQGAGADGVIAKGHEAEIFSGFSNADLDKLDELLEAIARNLSAARSVRAAGK